MKKGLELSRIYFLETAEPRLKEDFPDIYPRLAAGLSGNGSECFGYDDEVSRDHDWGEDFFLWVTDADRERIPELIAWKKNLLTFFPPEHPRVQSEYGANVTVMTCGDFYRQLVGTPDVPGDVLQWFRIPESNLAMCVNGEVFMDNAGDFSSRRRHFLAYFPEDFRLKKIAAKCMAIAQTGQYNLQRMAKRHEPVTVHTVVSRFIDAVTGLVFLLNRVYRPYYKWENRMLRSLPILGSEISSLLTRLASVAGIGQDELDLQQNAVDRICQLLHGELKRQEISSSEDWFFTAHGEEAMKRISHDVIRSLPATYE